MKKYIFSLFAVLVFALQANAITLSTARTEALFLTDKMAYELDLTPMQYDAVFEINVDYLTSIDYFDPYGWAWNCRNQDLRFVLSPYQYERYLTLEYFYRPVYFARGEWVYRIYTRYNNPSHFYFGRPHIYQTYSGGHSWRSNAGRSWYEGRTYHYNNNGMRNHLDNHGSSNNWRDGSHGNTHRDHNRDGRNHNNSNATQNHGNNNVGKPNGNWRQNSGTRPSNNNVNNNRNGSNPPRSNATSSPSSRSNSSSSSSNTNKRGSFGGKR